MKNVFHFLLLFLSIETFAMDKYCNGAPTLIHTNGGGRAAVSAIVSPSVFIGPEASVCEYAVVFGNVVIKDNARVYGLSRIYDGSIISGNAEVYGNSTIIPTIPFVVSIMDNARIYDNAKVLDSASIKGNSKIFENSKVDSNATVDENSSVYGNATISGKAIIKGNSKIHGRAYIGGDVISLASAEVCDGRYFEANTVLAEVFCETPVRAKLSTIQVAVGGNHTCSLYTGGRIRCWGSPGSRLGYGNLNTIGDNELPNSIGFVRLESPAIQVEAGSDFTCALLSSGNVKCWGESGAGQLGYGNRIAIGDNELPNSVGFVDVGGTVSQIAVGDVHTCVLLTNNKVRCWGDNTYGQLGYGNTNSIGDDELPSSAGDVSIGPGTVKQIVAGSTHSCALFNDGTAKCWGDNSFGQLGIYNTTNIGDNELPSTSPLTTFAPNTISKLALGGRHSCAILNLGDVRCWGQNDSGQLGYGNTTTLGNNGTTFGNVSTGLNAIQISAGSASSCIVNNAGKVRCWGSGTAGVLGQGNVNNIGDNELPSSVPEVNYGSNLASNIATSNHTCVVLTNPNRLRCWGSNQFGQLGLGNTNNIGDNEIPASVIEVGNSLIKN